MTEIDIRFEIVKSKLDKDIEIPQRATSKSAGYDFFATENVVVKPREIVLLPTGIKAKMPGNIVLYLYDRSSNARKRGLVLINSVGVIDPDYYENDDNDGEIAGQFMNFTDQPVAINKGDRIMQGVFSPFFTVSDDNAQGTRNGGFGSTDK